MCSFGHLAGRSIPCSFPCAYCQQQGMIENEERLQLRIPPMAPSGSIFEIPLGALAFYLRLHVFVEGQPG